MLARRRPSELEEEGGAHDALALGIDGVLINSSILREEARIDALCRSRRPAERGAEEGHAEEQYIGHAFILNSWEAQRRMRIAGAERLDELSSYH